MTPLRHAAAVSLVMLSSTALAADSGIYTFKVMRGQNAVGSHCVLFEHGGDRVRIRANTEIEVRFAIVPIFTFRHERHEIWENGRATLIEAQTRKNGEEWEITVRPGSHGGYVRTINGRSENFHAATTALTLWNKNTLEHRAFFSVVEDKTLQASFHFVGREKIALAGEEVEMERYRMVGDEERDLWYDPAGHVAKVRLRRFGSDITYVRDQLRPADPKSQGCSSRS